MYVFEDKVLQRMEMYYSKGLGLWHSLDIVAIAPVVSINTTFLNAMLILNFGVKFERKTLSS